MAKGERYLRFMLLAGSTLTAVPALAGDLPTGASVTQGRVSVSSTGNAMTIRQRSGSAVVNWRYFSIGQGATVDIRQPSSRSAILNRVTGDTTTTIAGQLTANGQVFLVNPNGIAIGPSGTVKAGGFVASTLGISDEDFVAGRRRFTGNGASAAVDNRGRIEVARHGAAALLGGRVSNSGVIEARLGRVGLASGEQVTLDFTGDGFLKVAVPTADDGKGTPLVEMNGRIAADGGRVELTAAAARDAARRTVNLGGVVEARSVGGRSGDVVLGGGGGAVTVSGRIDVRAPARSVLDSATPPMARPKGGNITVTGEAIALAGATLDASGAGGGGAVRVGGDWHGGGELPRAATVSLDGASTIAADALVAGDGGSVVVWSDESTRSAGRVFVRGGPLGGDGGAAELSGKLLTYSGRTDLSAAAGSHGTLLLDPIDLYIENADGDPAPGVIDAGSLVADLAGGDVVLTTVNGDFSDQGNITVGAALSWGDDSLGGGTLTLQADNDIILAQPITSTQGGLALNAVGTITTPTTWTDSTGATQTGGNGAINVGTFILQGGSWVQNAATLPTFQAIDFQNPGGSFLRAVGGNGSRRAPYRITDIYGLQGVDSPDLLGTNFALASNINATGTGAWNGFDSVAAGFMPIGSPEDPFTGLFDGGGFVVNGLVIASLEDSAGLFGAIGSAGSVQNLGLLNVAIDGAGQVGGLAGQSFGRIARSFVTSGVEGGIVGETEVGGLVGLNGGTISQSFASATVTQTNDNVFAGGGLVGENAGRIVDSYASGQVNNFFGTAGGLVGNNGGVIVHSYSSAEVPTSDSDFADEGGLVGQNSIVRGDVTVVGSVRGSFWDVDASGQAPREGEAGIGLTTEVFQNTEEFMAQAEPLGWNFDTVWAPPGPAGEVNAYPGLYAVNPVVRIVADDTTRLYGEANPTLTSTTIGGPGRYVFSPAGDVLSVPVALDTSAAATSPVGAYAITAEAPSLVASSGDITYRVVTTDGTFTITPAPLTITAHDQTKIYGDEFAFTSSDFTITGLVNGESLAGVGLESPGTDRRATVAGGPYTIDVLVPDDPVLDNYAVTTVDGLLTVDRRSLTITAGPQRKIYGEGNGLDNTRFSTNGLVNGDQVSSVELRSDGTDPTATVAGGPYAIVVSEFGGTGLDNYAVTTVDGLLTVDRRPLTITADPQRKIYGEGNGLDDTRFSTNGLVNGDRVSSVELRSDGTDPTATVAGGPYAILVSEFGGTGLDNYAVTTVDGLLTVDPRPLTITANDQVKRFGTTFRFDGTEFTAPGLVNGDRIDKVNLTSLGAEADASIAGSPYAIVASGGEPRGVLSNYAVTYQEGAMVVIPLQPIVASAIPGGPILPPEESDPILADSFTLPSPPDTLIMAAASETGAGTAAGGPVKRAAGDTVAGAQDMLAYLEQLSGSLDRRVSECQSAQPETVDYLACISAALRAYSGQIGARVVDLPEPLRQVSAIIERTSRSIAGARARAAERIARAGSDEEIRAIEREATEEARAAVRGAIADIHKQIDLISVNDPDVAQIQVQQGQTIAAALKEVDDGLLEAVEL